MFESLITVWCVGWALAAGIGAWRYLRPWSSRAVRVAARVERVEVPRASGADIASGVQAVLAFQDPTTGEELTLPTTGARNGTLTAAWVGRQVTVRFPAGRPYRFRVVTHAGRQRDLAPPVVAACFAWAGLVARLATTPDGIGWAPIGIGALVTALAAGATVATRREGRNRAALLATATDATAHVVASVQSTYRDSDTNRTHTSYVPVVTFPTTDGHTVTAVSPHYTSRPRPHTVGTTVPVRYAPADPSVFAFDTATDRRSYGCGTVLLAGLALGGVAAMAVGLAILGSA